MPKFTHAATAVPELEHALNAFERSVVGMNALDEPAATHLAERLALYRTLVGAIKKISPEPMSAMQDGYEARVLAADVDNGVQGDTT